MRLKIVAILISIFCYIGLCAAAEESIFVGKRTSESRSEIPVRPIIQGPRIIFIDVVRILKAGGHNYLYCDANHIDGHEIVTGQFIDDSCLIELDPDGYVLLDIDGLTFRIDRGNSARWVFFEKDDVPDQSK